MTAHRAVIEAGPTVIRRLCCGAVQASESWVAAVEAVDDAVTLVDEQPVAVEVLWSEALRTLAAGHDDGVIVVHPSWWSAARIGVITSATKELSGAVTLRPRSWLLATATGDQLTHPVSVEITGRLVAVLGTQAVAVARRATPQQTVGKVVEAVVATGTAPVVIDAAGGADGAAQLATLLAEAVPGGERTVLVIDDARLARLARAAASVPAEPPPAAVVARRGSSATRLAAAAVAVTGLAVPALAVPRPGGVPLARPAPTTVLLEGRVALTVPADWATQRVVSGPGSARVQITSPTDPEVALHVTQSPTPGETLSGAAETLRRAIDAEPAGVFVDFNPAGSTAGRPAVTYREVRAAHDVRWTVLLDGSVRISVGCQSRARDPDAVRDACEQAVRSAHAVE